jgi:hypothetical protein
MGNCGTELNCVAANFQVVYLHIVSATSEFKTVARGKYRITSGDKGFCYYCGMVSIRNSVNPRGFKLLIFLTTGKTSAQKIVSNN